MATLEAGDAGGSSNEESVRHIVFFDVETNVPGRICRSYELLEFGAVVLDARGLGELGSFHTLIRPNDLSCIDRRTSDCNTITPATVADAPAFGDVAADIYKVLHGHIWAGHNILKFDVLRVNEAFSKIGQQAPQPFGVIDTYPLLRKTFGKRAGNFKLQTLASYCGYGKQEHRSIADVRMNINVLRSCAAMLFLESNYPDIFGPQIEVAPCTSISEQSAVLSSPFRLSIDEYAEQEVDSEFRLSDQVAEPLSISRPSHSQSRSQVSNEENTTKLSEVTDLLRTTRLLSEAQEGKDTESESVRKECTHSSCSWDVKQGERRASSECIKVSSSVSKSNCVQEDLRTGYEHINGKIYVAEIVDDRKSLTVGRYMKSADAQTCEALIHNSRINSSDSRGEHDTSKTELSFSVKEDVHEEAGARTESEGVSFLLASQVTLSSIEVRRPVPPFVHRKMLFYEGFPLHLLELKIRVRFTINLSYAFDEKGRPRFSILVEPSESACNVISQCEDAVKSMSACDGEVGWLPALRKESGCWVARMSIGTKWGGSYSTYTTEFFHCTSNGREKLSLGQVDAVKFRNVIPHGCLIDVGFGFSVFNINNQLTGVKLLAKHITLT